MSSSQIQERSCFSYIVSNHPSLQSKWFVVALTVSSLVFLGAAAFGGVGLFASQLPQWLAHGVGTIGHSGCLAMLMWGTVLGGACLITAVVLSVKRKDSNSTTNLALNPDPVRETTEVNPPNEDSIETLNPRLIHAASEGRTEEIVNLLERGVDVNITCIVGMTPLMWAANRGHHDVVTTLLNRGANVHATDDRGRSALDYATGETRQVLLNWRSAHPREPIRETEDHPTNEEPREALETRSTRDASLSREERVEQISALLAREVERDAVSAELTPLLHAVNNGHIDRQTPLHAPGKGLARTDTNAIPLIDIERIEANTTIENAQRTLQELRNLNRDAASLISALANRAGSTSRSEATRQPPLHAPAEGLTITAMDRILRNFHNSNRENLHTRLFDAVKNGQTDEIVPLLEQGANIEVTDNENDGMTPLMWAAARGHIGVMTILLNCDADIDATDENGRTPLMFAASGGHLNAVTFLLDRGANINLRDRRQRTAIDHASAPEIRQLLVDTRRSLTETLNPLLLEAASTGNREIIGLFAQGAEIEATDQNGKTPLMLAAAGGHYQIVGLLHFKGANLNATDNNEQTALMHAAAMNHERVISTLLDRRANVNATDSNGRTALMHAAMGGHREIVNYFLQTRGLNIEIRDHFGRTAEDLAVGEAAIDFLYLN